MTYDLGITERCLKDDLGCQPQYGSLEDLAHEFPIVDAFVNQRSQLPIGQEAIQGFTSSIVPYSLHAGRERGLTWHWESRNVVWLLAARFHTSGAPDDAYPYFRELDAKGRLLPTTADLEALESSRQQTLTRELFERVPVLRDRAIRYAGSPVVAKLASRIGIRIVADEGEPQLLTIAVSMRLGPGDRLPNNWLEAIAGAFIQGSEPADVELVQDFAGHPLDPDEVAFRGFA